MNLEDFEKIATIAQTLFILIGGIWVLRKYILQQERFPNVNFTADIVFIGKQNNDWIVELVAFIENVGKAQLVIFNFDFDLNALYNGDEIEKDDRWGNQINFPHPLEQGFFKPSKTESFFVDPGTKAKYSYITKVSDNAKFLILHTTFAYHGRGRTAHTAEKTVMVPEK